MQTLNLFIANMIHAIRCKETVSIGGGNFKPEELAEVVVALDATAHLKAALEALLACPMYDPGRGRAHEGRNVTINAKTALVENARAALAKLEATKC